MQRGAPRTPEHVASDHLDAVRSGNPEAMAADYAIDATLTRAERSYEGREAIEAYFRTVPGRLDGARVVFDEPSVDGDTATVRWHLEGGTPACGTDVLIIRNGRIVRQDVHLDSSDF